MELKTKCQYTYFIDTFVIKEKKYDKYVLKLLKDPRFRLRIFDKDKDLELYSHFLPKMREFLFGTFELSDKQKYKKFKQLPLETRAAILAKYNSVTFEYDLNQDIQGKMIDENSIFFSIRKIGIVLFNTGICFLYFKTKIEDNDFSNVLNFNHKFRDINQEGNNLKNYEKIKVQADSFENIEAFQDFIYSITGPNIEALKINIDTERFYTFSYTCINQEYWNLNTSFENIKNDFYKYVNILPHESSKNTVMSENSRVIANSKFSKIGLSKLSSNLICSECDINNYNTLTSEYENQYLYTYILGLYLKVYLKKLNNDFKTGKDIEKTRKDFIFFTKNVWIQEITADDIGSLYYTYLKEVLELERLYNDVKNKYNILYSELKIEKNENVSKLIIAVLVVILLFNIINFLLYFK